MRTHRFATSVLIAVMLSACSATTAATIRPSLPTATAPSPAANAPAGGARAAGIALVDGGGVHALGYGNNGVDPGGYVSAITARGDDVFIGGHFARAGGWLSAIVARFALVDDPRERLRMKTAAAGTLHHGPGGGNANENGATSSPPSSTSTRRCRNAGSDSATVSVSSNSGSQP